MQIAHEIFLREVGYTIIEQITFLHDRFRVWFQLLESASDCLVHKFESGLIIPKECEKILLHFLFKLGACAFEVFKDEDFLVCLGINTRELTVISWWSMIAASEELIRPHSSDRSSL